MFSLIKNSMDLENSKIKEKVELNAIYSKTLYFDKDSNFGIFVFSFLDEDCDTFIVKGNLDMLYNDNKLFYELECKIYGTVVEYNNEKQISIDIIFPVVPRFIGIDAFLMKYDYILAGMSNEIYNVYRHRSIRMLLSNSLEVISKLESIYENNKLTLEHINNFKDKVTEINNLSEICEYLFSLSLSVKEVKGIIKRINKQKLFQLKNNPYLMCEFLPDYDFFKVDEKCLESNISLEDYRRIRCAILSALDRKASEGHCYLTKLLLFSETENFLNISLPINEMTELYNSNENYIEKYKIHFNVDRNNLRKKIEEYNNSKTNNQRYHIRYPLFNIRTELLEEELQCLVKEGKVVIEEEKIYSTELYEAENIVANKLKKLSVFNKKFSSNDIEKVLNKICDKNGYVLEREQKKAIIEFNMYNSGVFVLTGEAGTGKTFVLNLMLEVNKRLQCCNQEILVAPTGKAAKVATNSTGCRFSTLHKELAINEYGMSMYNERNQINGNLFVVEESSMINICLFSLLMKSIKDGSKILLVGDINQISAIGPGNVLKDIINSNIAKVLHLTVIKRQSKNSMINIISNKILNSQIIPIENKKKSDYFFLPSNSVESTKKTVLKSVERILTFEGYTQEDVTILLPMKVGSLGVYMFNYLLQKKLNPNNDKNKMVLNKKFEITENNKTKEYSLYLKEGDKVMQTKNSYLYFSFELKEKECKNRSLFVNGECGKIVSITKTKGDCTVIVKYDDYYVYYDNSNISELELAYATTIHKYQGAESKSVIIPIIPSHFKMWTNNLLYTAVTRGKKFLVLVGDYKTLEYAIHNHKSVQRYTTLEKKLRS